MACQRLNLSFILLLYHIIIKITCCHQFVKMTSAFSFETCFRPEINQIRIKVHLKVTELHHSHTSFKLTKRKTVTCLCHSFFSRYQSCWNFPICSSVYLTLWEVHFLCDKHSVLNTMFIEQYLLSSNSELGSKGNHAKEHQTSTTAKPLNFSLSSVLVR